MKGDFSAYDEQIAKLTPYLESSESEKVRDKIEELSLKKAKKCDQAIEEAASLYNENMISYQTYVETVEELSDLKEDTLTNNVSWYTEAVTAKVYDTALKEILALSTLGTKILGGYMLTTAGKKYVRERLSKYPLLNEDAINCSQLTCETYSLEEAKNKFHVTLEFAENWEKGGQQTHCKVYFYDKKPVMIIAYNRAKKDNGINNKMTVETKILDSRFKKHEDYYTAYMTSGMQVMHPSIQRVLKKLKDQWKQASKKVDKEIQDSIDESVEDETIGNKYVYISEACKHGYLTNDQLQTYTRRLNVRSK